MLTVALEMGNLKAALDLAHVANLKPDGVIPPAALRHIRAAAVEHTDSRAMAVYARYLLNLPAAANPSTREDALELALELSLVSEPADPSHCDPGYHYRLPQMGSTLDVGSRRRPPTP